MKLSKLKKTTGLAILLVLLPSLVLAYGGQGCDGGQGCGRGQYGPPVMSDSENDKDNWRNQKRQYQHEMAMELLGLSEEQVEQIEAIREKERADNEALREKIKEYRDKMYELTDAGNFDEKAIRANAEEKAKIQVELAVSKARMHRSIHDIMTPEQQELAEKLRSVRQNRRGKHHKGYGRGSGMGRGRPDFE